jgi:ADP-ribose pyrophosphatase YjhB (NUDIX family)
MHAIIPLRFTVRVYGICIRDGHVLLCEEGHEDFRFIKFPGGGLEFGEGLQDALKREFEEELDAGFSHAELFYINDFFQASAFDAQTQVISVYYLVHSLEPEPANSKTEIRAGKPYELKFLWKPLEELDEYDLSFPIDRLVAKKLSALR